VHGGRQGQIRGHERRNRNGEENRRSTLASDGGVAVVMVRGCDAGGWLPGSSSDTETECSNDFGEWLRLRIGPEFCRWASEWGRFAIATKMYQMDSDLQNYTDKAEPNPLSTWTCISILHANMHVEEKNISNETCIWTFILQCRIERRVFWKL
jgi:hypothetical protein